MSLNILEQILKNLKAAEICLRRNHEIYRVTFRDHLVILLGEGKHEFPEFALRLLFRRQDILGFQFLRFDVCQAYFLCHKNSSFSIPSLRDTPLPRSGQGARRLSFHDLLRSVSKPANPNGTTDKAASPILTAIHGSDE